MKYSIVVTIIMRQMLFMNERVGGMVRSTRALFLCSKMWKDRAVTCTSWASCIISSHKKKIE